MYAHAVIDCSIKHAGSGRWMPALVADTCAALLTMNRHLHIHHMYVVRHGYHSKSCPGYMYPIHNSSEAENKACLPNTLVHGGKQGFLSRVASGRDQAVTLILTVICEKAANCSFLHGMTMIAMAAVARSQCCITGPLSELHSLKQS